ncbi:Uncharacterised protein [Mycobacteroides abscessus subsp. abscessus]|nr:Uncharacterised protein [Mycobacteroides abscessus subsp. abscessus]
MLDTVHRVDLGERGLCRQDQLGLTLHDRLYQFGPVLEVVIQLRFAGARGGQDVVETGCRDALLVHHLRGRIDDGRAGAAAVCGRGQLGGTWW